MIRINLLGQIRPKAARRPVDTGAALPVVFVGAGLVLGVVVLGFFYYTWQLQRDRTGGQELLDMVANTVSRTENLWLTEMVRKGNVLSMEGSSASVNAVANFITALKRSGYFQKVEIKESKQDDKNTGVQSFTFQISAEITPPPAVQTRPANAPVAAAKAPAKKG